jgi:ABC-2 type transport system ATP-binding protein
MQKRIREFIADYNRRYGATVLLTSHYMADVTSLCRRVVVIHHGRIMFDGGLAALASEFAQYKEVEVTLSGLATDLSGYGEVVSRDGNRVVLRVPPEQAPQVTAKLLSEQMIVDLTVQDAPLEDMIEALLGQGGHP